MLWRFEIQYAAEIQTVTSPHGRRYDILVHRDGVMLYSKREGVWNANSIFPTAIALIRRWRRGPWRWAVTVRQSRFHGYPDLLREVVDDHGTARRRAGEIGIRAVPNNDMVEPRPTDLIAGRLRHVIRSAQERPVTRPNQPRPRGR